MDKIQKYKTREYKAKGRFLLDNHFVDLQLASMPSVAAKVYLVLCRMVDKEQHCYPGTALLARKTGLSRQGVFNATKELEDRKLIAVDRAKKTSKENEVNHYHLIDRSEWEKGRVVKTVDHPTVVQELDHLIQKADHQVIKPVDSKDTKLSKDTQLSHTPKSPKRGQESDTSYKERNSKNNGYKDKSSFVGGQQEAEPSQPRNRRGKRGDEIVDGCPESLTVSVMGKLHKVDMTPDSFKAETVSEGEAELSLDEIMEDAPLEMVHLLHRFFCKESDKTPEQVKLTVARAEQMKRMVKLFSPNELMLVTRKAFENDFWSGRDGAKMSGTVTFDELYTVKTLERIRDLEE